MAGGVNTNRALVLGADIEGLAAAIVLAQGGRDVTIVDSCKEIGGPYAAREIHPGHIVPGLAHETELSRRSLLASLNLERHGLTWRAEEIPLHVLAGDDTVVLHREAELSEGLGDDREKYAEWRAYVSKLSGLIVDIIDEAPPEANDPGIGELFRLAKKGLKLRTLGDRDMMELFRIVTMPAWDWTEEWFQAPALRAGLTAPVLNGTVVGPRAAGTTALILMREAARGVEPVGGTAALVRALAARCKELGVRVVLGETPTEIAIENRATAGVRLANGETLEATLVLSAWDPKRTLIDLVDPGLLHDNISTEARFWRTRGGTAVHLIALSSAEVLPSGAERWITSSDPIELERAADALKYGALPEAPWLDVRVWEGAAPAGAATLSVHVHGVPNDLRSSDAGWDSGARTQLRNRILAALEGAVPGARDAIVADELLVPADIEAEFGLSGGHLLGGELALDQLWVQRPTLALSRYATPIEGLFLGGSANHPGGSFFGGAGVLAGRAALRS